MVHNDILIYIFFKNKIEWGHIWFSLGLTPTSAFRNHPFSTQGPYVEPGVECGPAEFIACSNVL